MAVKFVPAFKPMDNKISCGGFSILGGGISNKTIDLTPDRYGVWVINKEDAIAGNKKNVHFSRIPFLQLVNLIDDSTKGDFSRFPSGGQVLDYEVMMMFLYTKVASSFGLLFEGVKKKTELTSSEYFLNGYWENLVEQFSLNDLSNICFALSTDGISDYLIVNIQPTEPGKYLYCNGATGENELIEI